MQTAIVLSSINSVEQITKLIESTGLVQVIKTESRKDDLVNTLNIINPKPDIVFVTENADGDIPTVDLLCYAKQQYPNVRFVYFSGQEVDPNNEIVVNTLATLVMYNIYDICTETRLTSSVIADIIKNPKTEADVKHYYKYQQQVNPLPEKPVYNNQKISSGQVERGRENIFVFSSVKPGTGKSFISTNVAADIARFGKPKSDGELPSVIIVEGDLQTLSVGTLLGIENSHYNLREALNGAAKIVNEYGQIIADAYEQEEYKRFLRKCCLPYRDQSNLYALVGSQLNFTDIGSIDPFQYFYMIEVIATMFDIVIIDSNSSLEHKTTGPILQLANQCYYVLDLDFNNIRTNLRYRQELVNLGVSDKIKYVLNKAITKEIESRFAEKIEYDESKLDAAFEIAGRIPMLDNVVVLNRMFDKIPIVYDTSFATLPARMEFSTLANRIYPMDNALNLRLELDEALKKNKKKRKK